MPEHGPIRPFTKRQAQIAELIGRGLSYKAIAAKLKVQPTTVRGHVKLMALLFDEYFEDHVSPRDVILIYSARRAERAQKRAG